MAQSLLEIMGGDFGPDREVPCMDCGTPTVCTGFAWEMARLFNHELHERGEEPLRKNEIVRCEECSDRWQAEHEAELSSDHWRRVAIREARERAAQENEQRQRLEEV